MRIDDDKVYVKKVGNSLVIIPFHNPWQNMIDSLDEFTSDFIDDREQPTYQIWNVRRGMIESNKVNRKDGKHAKRLV